MLDNRFLRQQDAVDMKKLKQLPVTIIGAGSIGSVTAVWLGKMGIQNMTVFDDDLVQEHNWSNQLYEEADIDRPKVEALWDVMERFCGFTPRAVNHQYDGSALSEITVSCVDSMKSRRSIWKAVKQHPEVNLYIDARMGLETCIVHSVHAVDSNLRKQYAKSLHSDSEGIDEPCTARTICYTPLMAASLICNLVKRYVNDEPLYSQIVMDLVTMTVMI